MRLVITGRHGGVNSAEYARFVNDPNGPIRRDLRRRGTNVQRYQQKHGPRRTGTLVSTSRKRETARGPLRPAIEVIIGKDGLTDYLGYILFGTHAHVIRAIPNRPNAHLRFIQGGQIRFAKEVLHPGTKANPFVQRSLLEARR